jgi:vacuolar-type H+-ATPase subunit I/STV1
MKINIEKIRIDGDTQSRTAIHEKTVQDYTEVLLDGNKMPPIKLFHDGLDWWLADGFHRYFAHKRAKINEIECDITKGTKRDAKIYSLGANHDHGLPRTNEDKRKSVMTCLEDIEMCDLKEREVARICNVSHTLVQRIKKELDLKKEIKPKVQKVEPQVALMPEEEEYEDDKLHELVVENKALLKENTQLRDKIAVGLLDVSEEEKIEVEETIESLRAEVERLQSELDAMTISRNDYQQKAADAISQVQYWKRRAEKTEKKLKSN